MRSLSLLLMLSLLPVFALALPVSAAEPSWSQWRGPSRDGQISGSEWPEALKGRAELVWEQQHGPSYSGPIVGDGLVFTTETVDQKSERITAYRLDSGEKVWSVDWPGAMTVPFFAAANGSWIRSTPACTDSHLVVLGMRDVLVCLDPKTGDEFWRVDFPQKLGSSLPAFGGVCSPLIDGDAVYVQTGGELVKMSLADGSVVWKALGSDGGAMSGGAFSSPVIATIADQRQLVVQTRQELCGVDLASGGVLWKEPITAFRGMNILTPLVIGDRVFTSAYQGKAQLFEIQRDDQGWSVKERWSQKEQAYMSSPVLVDDTIYAHLRNQRVAAFHAETGERRWTSKPFGKYWSMVCNGKRILALDSSGDLRLIACGGSELDVVDQMKVAENSWAHLAADGEYLIVRDLASLKVYRWK